MYEHARTVYGGHFYVKLNKIVEVKIIAESRVVRSDFVDNDLTFFSYQRRTTEQLK